ncbi:acyltransferase domain-containing protein [Streptomyces sp. NPDC097107]|uniref:acyltransferase domain-containing protein n=1 Tax=Streptomyces sp. NPDC097107 TaxID=3366089 RepID=UPI00381B1EC1
MTSRIAVLFPGQGAYLPGVLAERASHFPGAMEVLETVDKVAGEHGHEPISPLLLDLDAPPLEDLLEQSADRLDLAIYAINAAAYEILLGLGLRADVLVGHSFGEFAALSAAGAVSVADVARMACSRTDAFHRANPGDGGLVALGVPAWRARHIVGLLDDPNLHLAIDNGPGQTVVSGPLPSLGRVEELAVGLGLRATRLRAGYAFHNPLLHGAGDIFRRSTADVRLTEPRTPVFSPVLGRHVRTAQDARDVIERNMVAPVRFYDGLLSLFRAGTTTFVEAGARQALTGIVKSSLPPSALAIPLLPSRGDMARVKSSVTEAGFFVDWAPPVREDRGTDAAAKTPADQDKAAQPEPEKEPLPDREKVVRELAEMYAEELGFPVEMLTADIDIEADLGVDSMKQLALFQRVRRQYGIGEPPPEHRARATTLDKIAALVEEQLR